MAYCKSFVHVFDAAAFDCLALCCASRSVESLRLHSLCCLCGFRDRLFAWFLSAVSVCTAVPATTASPVVCCFFLLLQISWPMASCKSSVHVIDAAAFDCLALCCASRSMESLHLHSLCRLLFDVVEPLLAAEEVSTTDQTASDVRVVAALFCCIALKKLPCGLTSEA